MVAADTTVTEKELVSLPQLKAILQVKQQWLHKVKQP